MSKSPQHSYEFGSFFLDARKKRLLHEGRQVKLTPKEFELLVMLVECGGDLVEKRELMDALWPGTHVGEETLTQNVSTLRKALRKASGGEEYIETVPTRGYCFAAEIRLERHTRTHIVEEEEFGDDERDDAPRAADVSRAGEAPATVSHHLPASVVRPARTRRTIIAVSAALCVVLAIASLTTLYRPSREARAVGTVGTVAPSLGSVAVLPFRTVGAGDEYLGTGMSDTLIVRLSGARRLVVRPMSAVRRYADSSTDPLAAGREQQVEAVLDGSVQRAGDRIRVRVQLLRVADGAALWSDQFDEKFTDIFAVQDAIARRVVAGLAAELSPEERARLERPAGRNVAAYEAYLKGRYFWNKRTPDGFEKAIGHFRRAVEIDPNFARAYVGLSDAYMFLGWFDLAAQREAAREIRGPLERALALDEALPEAHASLGLFAMNYEANWERADREYRRAIEIDPNFATAHQWYGEFLAYMGRFDEAIREIERARELDPLSLIINTDVGKVYTLARRYDQAIEQYRRALELDSSFNEARWLLGATYSFAGRHEEAVVELRKLDPERNPSNLAALCYAYGAAGRKDEARAALARLEQLSKRSYVSPVWMTVVHSGLGDRERAFETFERVFAERAPGGTLSLKVNPFYDGLRSDPRFAELLRRAKLPA